MKQIETIHAVGQVIRHDITRIVRGEIKDTAFRKGHIVTEEDIPVLLSLGKDHLYIFEKDENMLHENEAAEILCSICKNENMEQSEVKEGKIELIATCDGLFTVDVERLDEINSLDDMMIATRNNYMPVKKGDKLAGTRIIPLTIQKERMEEVIRIGNGKPLLTVHPYRPGKAGIVTTGNEVFYGRIKDTFTDVIIEKIKPYGIEVMGHEIVNDEIENIKAAILKLKEAGADMIITTGGMSVDPDDLTPAAIKASGAKIITYGAPVLPGAMFLLGYFDDGTPIMGLPGCVMYASTTIFDLMLPRICSGVRVEKKDIAKLGNGGLCLKCSVCHYPICGFGKGV